MLASKPDFIKDNNYINSLYDKIQADPERDSRPIYTSVHFSDLHMDYSFTPTPEEPYGVVGGESPYSLLLALLTYVRD